MHFFPSPMHVARNDDLAVGRFANPSRTEWHSVLPVLLLLACFTASVLAGCSGNAAHDPAPVENATAATGNAATNESEKWYAIYIGDEKIGHGRRVTGDLQEAGRTLTQITDESEMTIKRFGSPTTTRQSFSSTETPDGQLVRFRTEQSLGPIAIVATGLYLNGKLEIETSTLGKKQSSTIDWNPQWRGFFGYEQSLTAKPMQPGEKRTVRCLLPDYTAGDVTLTATAQEPVLLLSESRALLKIQCSFPLGDGGSVVESHLWTDAAGEIHKMLTVVPSIGQAAYLTTKEIALQETGVATFDLGELTSVKVKTRIDSPHSTRRVVYCARVRDGNPAQIFPSGSTQSVRSIDDSTAEIVVEAITPDRPAKLAHADTPPTDDDRLPNSLIQSDDQRVVALAAEVAPGEQDPWRLALALEKFVHDRIKEVNFSQALATAAEVAQSLEGDCTEHAMLLAALCRARQIPARVAMGLVYFPTNDGGTLAYHMWTEVWISDRWIPLDAILGRGGIGGCHLKVAQSNLQGASAFTAFGPVIQVMGRLELEIVEAN